MIAYARRTVAGKFHFFPVAFTCVEIAIEKMREHAAPLLRNEGMRSRTSALRIPEDSRILCSQKGANLATTTALCDDGAPS